MKELKNFFEDLLFLLNSDLGLN